MRRAVLVIWVLAGIFVIAAVTLAILLLLPTMEKLTSTANRATEMRAGLERLEASAVGEKFETDLRTFGRARQEKSHDVAIARARLASRLDANFREMKIVAGALRPTTDEFQRAYAFHGDQLRSKVRDLVARAGGPEAREIALMVPPFSSGAAPDEATMIRWQRFANIEARVLETAAKSGAPPAAALRLEIESPPADDADSGYERIHIGLDLLCPEGRTSAITHALLASFDDHGGIMKLMGLSETPVPEATLREKPTGPTKRVSISLSLGFPTPMSEETP